ncbi:MAG TPA: flagellar motor protein MotB [Polyangiaceae bacterium]|jgi:chemotaxis protein MotB
MARKKKHAEHVNHERWLVSYADFITLLFAFFVVMFAVSQVDSKKVGRFTEAFSKAVGIDVFPMSGQSLMSGGRTPDETAGQAEQGFESVIDELQKTLANMSASKNEELKGLQVIKLRNELVLRLPEGVFFDSGDARVKESTSRMLKVLLPELKKRPVEVRIEGHTDNRPISTGRFRSNWELSTARASAVLERFFQGGMPPDRMSIAGYGEYRPIADNAIEEGRKQNRRVDIVVTAIVETAPEKGAEAEAEKPDKKDSDKAAETDDDKAGDKVEKADKVTEKTAEKTRDKATEKVAQKAVAKAADETDDKSEDQADDKVAEKSPKKSAEDDPRP